MTHQRHWEPSAEAAKAFQLTDCVEAVVFCSDVSVVNAVRGKTRRKQDKLLDAIRQLLGKREIEKARHIAEQTAWPGQQAVFWLTSIQALTSVIEDHDEMIRRKRIAAGVSIVASVDDPRVVFFDLWWDR